ncbi:hypothetical protein JYU02_00805 [bacterium AH-315-P15]|nr:hypothetical protein [bacterium AH-315-P15]
MLGEAGRVWGAAAIVMLIVYIIVAYRSGRVFGDEGVIAAEAHFAERHFQLNFAMLLDFGVVIAGLLILGFGGDLLVRSSVSAAQMMGLSETFIGLTIVALGTSAPELVVSILAAIKKQTDVALGNIIGSNLFNVLAVLGLTSVMIPVAIDGLASFDIGVMLAATALLVIVASTDHKITRREGMVLLGSYGAYLGLKLTLFL